MLYGDYVCFTKLTHVCTTCQQLYMHTVIIPLFARFHSSRISLCMTYVLVYNIFDIEYKNTRPYYVTRCLWIVQLFRRPLNCIILESNVYWLHVIDGIIVLFMSISLSNVQVLLSYVSTY